MQAEVPRHARDSAEGSAGLHGELLQALVQEEHQRYFLRSASIQEWREALTVVLERSVFRFILIFFVLVLLVLVGDVSVSTAFCSCLGMFRRLLCSTAALKSKTNREGKAFSWSALSSRSWSSPLSPPPPPQSGSP